MDLELRHLRVFVAVAEASGFTDAGIDLGVSQAAVSRTVIALEGVLGVRLLHRTSRSVALTAAGERVLARARHLLAEADALVREAAGGLGRLRFGHAWSALGGHTVGFQREWAARHPDVELRLVRSNSATGGLAEGSCDLAVVRSAAEDSRFAHAVVGHERRYCAMAAGDPWSARRSVRLADLLDRTVLVDRRTGTTTAGIWPDGALPTIEHSSDIDDWLTEIATGRCVGVTPESTVSQYRRDGITYKPVRDAPPVPVRLIWWRHDPHPATGAAVDLLTELYASPPA